MKYNLPPFNEKVTRGYFEQSILDFSTNLFTIPILGLSLAIGINALLIYMYSQNKEGSYPYVMENSKKYFI